jgi:hypothetical protein
VKQRDFDAGTSGSNKRVNRAIKILVAVATLLVHTGCTTLRALEDPTPQRIAEQVETGDRVLIGHSNGKTYDLEVTRVEPDALTGTAASGKRYRILYAGIRTLEVEQADALKSLGVGAGVVVVVGIALLAVALHDLDIHFGICE